MRAEIQAGLRQELVSALKPDSIVWRGALDGYMVAQELLEEANSELQSQLVSDMKIALSRTVVLQEPSLEQAAVGPDKTVNDAVSSWNGGIPTFVDDDGSNAYLSPSSAALMVVPQPLALGATP